MKKLLLSAVAVLMFAVAANAQEQGQIRARLGLAAGTKAGADIAIDANSGVTTVDDKIGLGVNLGVEYFVTDNISISPSYTYFFNSTEDISIDAGFGASVSGEISIKPRVFNLGGRYYFGDDLNFYALAGLAFQSVQYEESVTATFTDPFSGETITQTENFESDGSATSFNLGGGVELPLSDVINFNGQIKIMGGDDTETFDGVQFVLNAGVSYSFN